MNRRIQVEVSAPLYDVAAGKCLVPMGLDSQSIPAHGTRELEARVQVPRGLVVGFACETPGLWIMRLKVGRDELRFSSAGFPATAAAEGIAIPAREVVASQDLSAVFQSRIGHDVDAVSAYFWIEIDRTPPQRARTIHGKWE